MATLEKEKHILDVIGKSLWKIEDLYKNLLEQDATVFKSQRGLRNFLKNRPSLFDIIDTNVCCHSINVDTEIQQLEPLEKQIVIAIGQSKWKIKHLNKAILEQGVNVFQPKGTLNKFLRKRPNLFVISIIYVRVQSYLCHHQSAALKEQQIEFNNNENKNIRETKNSRTENTIEDIKIDFKQLKPIERDVLAVMGDKKWEINELKVQLTGEKSYPLLKTFQAKGQLTSFLKNRPHLFVKTDKYVQRNLLPNQGITKHELNNLVPEIIKSCKNFRDTSPIDVIGIAESILEI